jgi:transposase
MPLETPSLPSDLAAAHAMILAERAARLEAEARVRDAEAEMSSTRLEIERLRLLLAKARRERFGQSAERGARLVEQLELQLTDLEETVAEEDTAAELAEPPARPETRARPGRKPARRPLPEHLPRERIVYPAPCSCPQCGGPVRKLGEDLTETLECEPRRRDLGQLTPGVIPCRSRPGAVARPPPGRGGSHARQH